MSIAVATGPCPHGVLGAICWGCTAQKFAEELESTLVGREVRIAGGDIKATIIGVSVYPGPRLVVQCAWWHAGERKEQWLDALEVWPPTQPWKPRPEIWPTGAP